MSQLDERGKFVGKSMGFGQYRQACTAGKKKVKVSTLQSIDYSLKDGKILQSLTSQFHICYDDKGFDLCLTSGVKDTDLSANVKQYEYASMFPER